MPLALRFISGKYQGGEFAIPAQGELIIGRASDLDLVLVEDMVSRKHAKMIIEPNDHLSITDLGSTNGTFVNGEKVKRADLHCNDRVLIGTSILKIIDASELSNLHDTQANRESVREMMEELGRRAPSTSNMSGELEEVPLPDLLQLFATNKRSGILSISGAHRGKLYIKDGQILHAVIGGEGSLAPLKTFCRMVSWAEGSFQLDPLDDNVQVPEAFKESTESLLIEALRQSDEMGRFMSRMPGPQAELAFVMPVQAKLSALNTVDLDVLQLVINGAHVRKLMDTSEHTDSDVVKSVLRLLDGGYIVANEAD